MPEPGEHESLRARLRRRRRDDDDELEGAWDEPGSDELMDFEVLTRVLQEGQLADLERDRKIARRGE
jgi:hypothetical protein